MNALIASQLCSFVSAGPGVVRCAKCGKTLATDRPASQVKAGCRKSATKRPQAPTPLPAATQPATPAKFRETSPEALPCVHRGGVVRQEQCRRESCLGNGVWFPVLSCAQFGECSIDHRAVKGLHVCKSCRERTPPGESVPAVSAPVAVRTGPVRVAILTPDLGAGGAERWVASLVKFIARERAIVTAVGVVMDGQKWDAIAREITSAGTPVYGTRQVRWGIHPTSESTVTFLASDADVTRRTVAGADVVVSWGISDPARLLTAAGWRGPHVVVSHGSSAWAKEQLRTAVPSATHCIAVSSDAAKAFPEGVKPEIIWNGSELERLAPTRSAAEVRESWSCTPDQLLIGYVGRLSPEKNPLAVAHLVREMRRRMPGRDIRPVWIGTGLEQVVPDLQREAAEIAGARCVWVPPPAHIGDAWQALDLHVMASPEEGFSLVVTEALMAGVPTVATRVGIVPDILTRWGNLVVPVDINPTGEQLADAAELALFEGHRPNVTRARQVVWEEFTAARMGARWGAFLEGIA